MFFGMLFAACLAACDGVQVTQPAPAAVAAAHASISDVVAFMGDSITQLWDIPDYDMATPSINFGVADQTTPQMEARFNNDVIASAPGVVVILGGINDLWLYGPSGTNIDSIKAMAAAATAANIKVILCSVMPSDFLNQRFALSDIEAFNAQLIQLAKENGYLYADYYDEFLTPDGQANNSLLMNGLHPNAAGYTKMWAVLKPLIAEDLGAAY
jgi:lysophospholipase L1-like esterase